MSDTLKAPVIPDEVRKWFRTIGTRGGQTKTPARLAALAKARRQLKRLRKRKDGAKVGTIEAGTVTSEQTKIQQGTMGADAAGVV